MNELPAELRMPPPRPTSAAAVFLAKTKKTATRMLLGGAALFPVVVALFWLNFGDLNAATVGIAAGISGLVELMGVALLVNARASLKLFETGHATMGTVTGARSAEAALILEIEFRGSTGAVAVAQVTVLAAKGEALKVGDAVPVLYSAENARRCAIFTPALGMMAGVTKRA